MTLIRENISVLIGGGLFIALGAFLIWNDSAPLLLAPLGLMLIYFALFHTTYTYLSLGLLTPFSINIEEYVDGFGLYIPTEPILFGLMILMTLIELRKRTIPLDIWKNPIVISTSFYLFWVFITSITSSSPIVSFKFLLSKLWFIIPLLFFGVNIFMQPKNIKRFLWFFLISMSLVICYTLIVHSTYNFGEEEGHWVMFPFFKDHTIYGCMVAFSVPIVFGLYFSKKHIPLVKIVLILLAIVILTGLFFSYTRAAWLSVFSAIFVLLFIRFKVKFSTLFVVGLFFGTILLVSWDNIMMELERNKFEHTTEEFSEKLQSATNVTSDASNLERLNRWSCAIEMFKKRPVFGFGPGTYSFEYARFQDPNNLTIISTNFGDMGNAHSEYLGPLSESGLIGMLAVIAIVISIFYKSITLYIKWPPEDKELRIIVLTMILSMVTYFVHGLLNNYLDTDKASVPIWTFCAAIVGFEIMLKRRSTSNPERGIQVNDRAS